MKKVVIIDDSSTQLNILKLAFEKNHWSVCTVIDTRQAIDVIYRFAPDLVITDAIMPNIGGFQLIKIIRCNEHISKIPIIVYSILSENNAKFYIKRELNEFFLRKNDNVDELVSLAKRVVSIHPLDEKYKENILDTGYSLRKKIEHNSNSQKETNIIAEAEVINQPVAQFDSDDIKKLYNKSYDFSLDIDTLIEEILELTYRFLNYDLAVLTDEAGEKKVYFDIKSVILSPIFQSNILNKYQTKNYKLYKKYVPNAKTIIDEDSFLDKIEFTFEYQDKILGQISFYSTKESFKQDERNLEAIKEGLFNFFKMKYINKNSISKKKETAYDPNKTTLNNLKKFANNEEKGQMYLGIIQIRNYNELKTSLNDEDLDFVTTKVSEKIIGFLDEKEQVKKDYNNEYSVILFAKDKEKARCRLSCIVNALCIINITSNLKIDAVAAIDIYNTEESSAFETEKRVRKLLEEADELNRAIIG